MGVQKMRHGWWITITQNFTGPFAWGEVFAHALAGRQLGLKCMTLIFHCGEVFTPKTIVSKDKDSMMGLNSGRGVGDFGYGLATRPIMVAEICSLLPIIALLALFFFH